MRKGRFFSHHLSLSHHQTAKFDISYIRKMYIYEVSEVKKFKKGDIVARISYNKDVLFEITKIIKMSNNKEIMILKGITKRIEADSPKEDLELVDKRTIYEEIEIEEKNITNYIEKCLCAPQTCFSLAKGKFKFLKKEDRSIRQINTGKILHLDGDRRYSEKSMRYYRSLGLNAIVKNIPENRQALVVQNLLDRYEPDILIITRT